MPELGVKQNGEEKTYAGIRTHYTSSSSDKWHSDGYCHTGWFVDDPGTQRITSNRPLDWGSYPVLVEPVYSPQKNPQSGNADKGSDGNAAELDGGK